MSADLCVGCGHDEHDAWDCRYRYPNASTGPRTRCACDHGYDGQGDLDTDDGPTVTRGEVEAARIASRAHGADRSMWDVQS